MSEENPSLARCRFQRMLEMLEGKEGRGTELITVYIPPGKQLSEVMSDLRTEWGTAGNIKSKTTKKNVQDGLTKVMEQLKLFRTTPPTGLVLFAGTIASEQHGVGDMETYTIIPPSCLKFDLFWAYVLMNIPTNIINIKLFLFIFVNLHV